LKMHHRSTEIRCSIFPKEHLWPPTTSDETTKQFPSIQIRPTSNQRLTTGRGPPEQAMQ
ncbi:hypothetical protein ACLOJK_034197, partial [Asimina triloba]